MIFYLLAIIISFCKFIRILFQIGEFYFAIILFGIYLETSTLLITSSSRFMSGAWIILEIFIIIAIFIFTNIISILPLTLQFWEVGNLRYIKKKNPFKAIFIDCSDTKKEIHFRAEIIMDTVCFIVLLLYIISLAIYNYYSIMFEVMNAIIFVIFPIIKFLCIFIPTFLKGIRIFIRNFDCKCCSFNEDKVKELVNYNKFETKIENKEPQESFLELQPVQLLMYNKKIDYWFQLKFWITIISILFILLVYPIHFRDGSTFFYLFLFFILSIPLSLSVPNNLFFILNFKDFLKNVCCCFECSCLKINESIIKISEKYKGFKYWNYLVQALLNLIILVLIIIVTTNNDYEQVSVDKRLGDINKFDKITIEDFTEQSFSRNYVKSPMCFTTIHHLNFYN